MLLKRVLRSALWRNIISNYLAVIWLGGMSFVTLPIYVHTLGRAGWAVIAASMAIQIFVGVLDAGFSQVMPRWFAQVSNDLHEQAKLYRVFSRLYILLGLVGFLLGQIFAGILARNWFHTGHIPSSELELGFRIVLFQLLFQFANSANIGYWYGIQLQPLANWRQCLFMTLKQAGALLSIFFIVRSPLCYLASFALVGALECLANRRTVTHRLGVELARVRYADREEIRGIVFQAGGLNIAVLIGTLVSQLDRIVLTRTQDISAFGTYTIVASIAFAFFQLQAPLTRAFLPRLAMDAKLHMRETSRTTARLFVAMMSFCVLPCLLVAAVAPFVLKVWLHNDAIVAGGTLPLRLLLVAVALNSIYNVFYQNIIVSGKSSIAVAINVACLIMQLLVISLVGTHIGITLGGLIWIVNSSTQFCLGALWYFLFSPWGLVARRRSDGVG